MKNFLIEEEGHSLKFISMNRRKVQLFQVYVTVDGQQNRFHMQVDESSGAFYITDKAHCPPVFHQCEKLFSDAIKNYGVADKMPT
ncbi:hypothetical protein SNE25_08595 [Mucilaginibacter sabulilitoris]|uniref:KTSC domain-containing protein n=1 Tax=Mucilaginibacter sabulilitoris TaxID=1173583 RepID=A0ABZ0TR16_9SPHI|nr:hypothetical protein [Mucilaginibacter sabulilitoris]WPU95580.1 hypothetical protein SNE25_08595 [Mucilaginibacter sabulilitoris]